jgi:alcohol dehydrogenase class IV
LPEVTLPRRIVYGSGAIVSLLDTMRDLNVSRTLVLTDERSGFIVKDLKGALSDRGIANDVIELSPGEIPLEDEIFDALRKGEEVKAEAVVGLGGPKAVFASKIVSVLMKRHIRNLEEIKPITFISAEFELPHLVVVPLYGGWGGGSLRIAFYSKNDRLKALINRSLIPQVIVLDPSLAPSLSKRTLQSIIGSALAQAVETYLFTSIDDLAEAMILHSVRLLFKYAPQALKDPSDMEAWERVQIASIMAGASYSLSSLPLTVLISTSLSLRLKVPSGLLSSIILPRALSLYERVSALRERLELLKENLELGLGLSRRESFLIHLEGLYKTMGLPRSLKELGVDFNIYNSAVNKLLEEISTEPYGMSLGPMKPALEQLLNVLKDSYESTGL